MKRVIGATLGAWLMTIGAVAIAAPQNGTCELTRLWQQALSPGLPFPFVVDLAGEKVAVVLDPETGSFTFDGSAVPPLSFSNSFTDARDVIWFPENPATGTIDSGGNVVVPGMEFRVCTFGSCPGGGGDCNCVPGNLCSNDTSRICIAGATTGELACENGGVCQGVCSDDQSKTCAIDDDCLPSGYCGQGSILRLRADLTTGTATIEDFQLTGSAASAFIDGRVTFVDVFRTLPETPVIGDTGITSMVIDCTLDPVPDGTALPPPPSWVVKKGSVKLGKDTPGAADDKLALSGTFSPLAGLADFDVEDLVLTLAAEAGTVVSLRIPAGSLVANKKGTKWKLVDKTGLIVEVGPPLLPGSEPSHKISIKKKGGEHRLALKSKNLDLDELNGAAQVTSSVLFGFQTPEATTAAVTKKSKVTF